MKINNVCYLVLIIASVVVTTAYSGENVHKLFSDKLPIIELEANTGVDWYFQFKANLNITENIYLKYRQSESFLSSDRGIILGHQNILNVNNRIQFGLGYSKETDESLFNEGLTEHWDALIVESDYIHYLNNRMVRFGLNIGFNFTINARKKIPSTNAGIIIGISKKTKKLNYGPKTQK